MNSGRKFKCIIVEEKFNVCVFQILRYRLRLKRKRLRLYWRAKELLRHISLESTRQDKTKLSLHYNLIIMKTLRS